MSASVGYATLQIIPSARGFTSALQGQIASPMAATSTKAGADAGKRFGGGFASIAGPLVAGVFAVKAVGFLKDAVSAASDLGEVQSKVNVLFGKDGARALDKWSNSSASALGQSKTQALDAASTFGVFAKSAGLAGSDAVGFSTKMTGLASDLASFSNTTPEEAITAIGAALRGESEPIRRYGVLLDDATLRQEALKMGLIKTTSQALTPQQRVLAAQSQILKQTKDAQGDFARTSGGLANQQRILAANFENVKTKVGSALLPVVTKFVTFLNANLLPTLKSVGDFLTRNADVLVPLGAAIGAIVVAIGAWVGITKVMAIAQGILNAVLYANPVGLVVLAVVGLIAALVMLYKRSETFRKIVQTVFRAVMAAIKPLIAFLVNTVWPIIQKVFSVIAKIVKTYVAIWLAVFIFAVQKIISTAKTIWNITEPIRNAFGAVVSFLSGLIGKIASIAGKIWDVLVAPFRGIFGVFSGIASDVADGLWSGLLAAKDWLVSAVMDWVKDILPGPVEHALGIASPSKVMAEKGLWAAKGMEIGIRKGAGGVAAASRDMALGASAAAAPPGTLRVASGAGVAEAAGGGLAAGGPSVARLYLDGRQISEAVFAHGGREAAYGRRGY